MYVQQPAEASQKPETKGQQSESNRAESEKIKGKLDLKIEDVSFSELERDIETTEATVAKIKSGISKEE